MPAAASPPVAPSKESWASWAPVTTSGPIPHAAKAEATPAMNSAALPASRVADVATKRTRSTPSSSH